MKIEGFTDDQLAALCEMWHLGTPIDVIGFFDRLDIPVEAKDRVREVGVRAAVLARDRSNRGASAALALPISITARS